MNKLGIGSGWIWLVIGLSLAIFGALTHDMIQVVGGLVLCWMAVLFHKFGKQ